MALHNCHTIPYHTIGLSLVFNRLQRKSLHSFVIIRMDTQPRVNSKLMNQYIGHNVLLVGEVVQAGMDRNIIRASDGGEVVIQLPPGQALERYPLVNISDIE